MASKKQDFKLDDYGFSDDLGMPSFDYRPAKTKDDRHPVTKVALDVGHGAAQGAKEAVLSPSLIRNMIRNSLPQGYGAAIDMADRTGGTLKNLYNDTVKEIKPLIRDLKATTKKVMPSVEPALPKNIADRIKKWTNSNPDQPYASLSADAQRDASLQIQLGEIFQFQTKAQLKREAEDDARDTIKTGIEHSRHRDMLGQLDAMRVSLQQLASYQNKVDAGFQRKSLELQYRHYFVAMDALQEQKRQNAVTTTLMGDIVKNTGLPDMLKLHEKDRLTKLLRNKFASGVGSVFSKRNDFFRTFTEEVEKVARSKIASVARAASTGIGAADAAASAADTMKDMGGPSGANTAGQMGGNYLTNMAAEWLAGKVKKFTTKIPAIVRGSNRLNFLNENKEQMLGAFAKSDKGQTGRAITDVPLSIFKSTLTRMLTPDNTLTTGSRDTAGSMLEPTHFSRGTSKAITEVIPGYLSRIYRELQIIRTGDTKTELTVYDFAKNKFSGATESKRNILNSIVKDGDKQGVSSQLDSMLNLLDPRKKLTPEMRKLLGQQLLSDNQRNDAPLTQARMTNPDTYTGKAGKYRDKYAEIFQDFHFTDDSGQKANELSRGYRGLGQSMANSRAAIQDFVNTGNREPLEQLGLLTPGSDQINMDQVARYHHGEDMPGDLVGGTPTDSLGRPTKMGRSPARPPSHRRSKKAAAAAPAPAPVVAPTPVVTENPYEKATENLVKAIQDASSKSISEVMSETLTQIHQQLERGILTQNVGGGEGGEAEGPRFGWNASLGSNVGAARRGLWGATKRTYGAVNKVVGGAFRNAGWVAGKGLKGAFGAIGGVRTAIAMIKDVYVVGDDEHPRMLAHRIRAGYYFNKDNDKPIKTWRDITGAVVDQNGDEVMTAEEASTCYVKSKAGKMLLSSLGATFTFVNRQVGNVLSAIPTTIRGAFSLVGKAYGLLKTAQDIYVKGKADPVMLARTMRAGGYFSRLNGKKIMWHGDIDGPVLDDQKNEVLTAQELAQGLYDIRGNRLRTPLARLLGAAAAVAGFGLEMASRAVKGVSRTVGRAFKGATDLAGSVVDGLANGIGRRGNKVVIDRLTEIRDLLSSRLPRPKGHVIGDSDGDGVRDGSYEDMLKHKKAITGENHDLGPDSSSGMGGAPGKTGMLGMAAGGIRGIYNRMTGKGGEEKKEGEGGSDTGSGIVDGAIGTAAGGAAMGVAKAGLKSAAKAGLWGVAKGAVKKAGWIGAGLSAYDAYKDVKKGNYGSAALDAGSAAATLALTGTATGAILSGAGAVGSAALGIGGALLGAISLPVVLGAAAVAAVGVGLYYAYKYATKKRLDRLSKVRYAQYGFIPTDEDHLQKVFGLEDQLKDQVKYDKGVAFIDSSKLDVKELLKSFDLTLDDKEEANNWLVWYNNRFKAVYLTHMTALKKLKPDGDLGDVDKFAPKMQKDYLGLVKFPEGPYSFTASPFKDLKSLAAGAKEVSALVAEADELIDKDIKDKKGESPYAAAGAAATAATAAAKPGAAKPGDPAKPGTPGVATAATGAAAAMAAIAKDGKPSASGLDDSKGVITAMGVATPDSDTSSSKLDALSVIRYKTYGLVKLEEDKVHALDVLETAIAKDLQIGKGNQASWTGSGQKLLDGMGSLFGIHGSQTNDGYNWLRWLNARFLPTYLAYAGAVAAATGKKTPSEGAATLTKPQRVDVAIAVYSATGTYNRGTVSVWQIPYSPWPDYDVNSDQTSVDGQMELIKKASSSKVLADEGNSKSGATGGKPPMAANAVGTKEGAAAATDPNKQGFFSKLGDKISDVASSAWGGVKNFAGKVGDAVGSYLGAATGQDASMGGGRLLEQPGRGTGGDINLIPLPKGNKSYAAVKDTLDAAAKMVGVDPKLMATMAALESGFDTTARPPKGGALGLFQFIPKTWNGMMKLYASKFGIDPGTKADDPRANALMGAQYIKDNADRLTKALKKPLTDTDIYTAHFLGADGAIKLLSADANANAAQLMPDPASYNPDIFYEKDKVTARTVAGVYAELNRRVRSRGKQFGLDSGGEMAATPAAAPPGAPTNVAAAAAATQQAAASGTSAASGTPVSAPAAVGKDGLVQPKATDIAGLLPAAPVVSNAMGIPVSDQAPGVAASGVAPAAIPQLVVSAKRDTDSPASTIGAGFASPRSRDLVAQADYQKDMSSKLLGDMGTTLQQSMGIQQNQLDVLTKILGLMGNGAKLSTVGTATPASNSTMAGDPGPARPMPTAPVSMDKPMYA